MLSIKNKCLSQINAMGSHKCLSNFACFCKEIVWQNVSDHKHVDVLTLVVINIQCLPVLTLERGNISVGPNFCKKESFKVLLDKKNSNHCFWLLSVAAPLWVHYVELKSFTRVICYCTKICEEQIQMCPKNEFYGHVAF